MCVRVRVRVSMCVRVCAFNLPTSCRYQRRGRGGGAARCVNVKVRVTHAALVAVKERIRGLAHAVLGRRECGVGRGAGRDAQAQRIAVVDVVKEHVPEGTSSVGCGGGEMCVCMCLEGRGEENFGVQGRRGADTCQQAAVARVAFGCFNDCCSYGLLLMSRPEFVLLMTWSLFWPQMFPKLNSH